MLARLAGVTACALALTVAGATTAQAASRTFVDGPGDVWTLGDSPNTRMPDRDQGDILRTTLQHGQQQVVVRHKFAELNREGRRIFIYTLLRTNTGQVSQVGLAATRRNGWSGRLEFDRRGGAAVECGGLQHHIDYAENVAVIRVPRDCIDNPRTVQAKIGVATVAGRQVFADNPINHRDTENLPPYTAPVRVG
jgi:hypothetical protein